MSVSTDTKNLGSSLSVDKAHPSGWQNCQSKRADILAGLDRKISFQFTHSMPSMNAVSDQSLTGNRCSILPLLFPDPASERKCFNVRLRHRSAQPTTHTKSVRMRAQPKKLLTFFFMIVADDDKVISQSRHNSCSAETELTIHDARDAAVVVAARKQKLADNLSLRLYSY